MDDASLVARAVAGDERAFEALVERHQRPVFAAAWRMLRDRDGADEATQRAFAHAFEHLRSFRGEASFATWLHRIAMNECRSILRASRRWVDLDQVPESHLAVSDAREERHAGPRLRRLLTSLPARQRAVVSLRVFSDLPFKEIARLEGITENSAKVNFHHGVRRLQRWLGRESS